MARVTRTQDPVSGTDAPGLADENGVGSRGRRAAHSQLLRGATNWIAV
jgi:hypothetical protein